MVVITVAASGALPLPIGRLSDYGNVLDRHGRARINSLIEATERASAIEVHILASWQTYDDVDRYAYALLDYWGLAQGRTVLGIFLKQAGRWRVAVAVGKETTEEYPGLAGTIKDGISDLVSHRRIEEAMVEIFSVIEQQIGAVDPHDGQAAGAGNGRFYAVILLVGALILVVFFIRRRICPRCGRILRVRRSRSFGSYGTVNVIYYCRRCGYSRIKKRRGLGGRKIIP